MKKKLKARKLPTGSKRTPSSKASTATTASPSKWIRIDRAFPLPSYVKKALETLDDEGHVAYVVGGCVRDFLLGRDSKDYDIATSASPDQICALFPDAITVGKSFGVIKVPTHVNPPLLEIATFREDLEYKDHRHPEGVRFAGPAEDARRRDFTINGLFYDPKTSRILDAVDGVVDLRAKVIRAIGDPDERFREDALRLLRAVRFATRLGFEIEPATAEAIQNRAKLISFVSAERIRDELTAMWAGPHPARSLELLHKFGLLKFILPELESLRGLPESPVSVKEGDVWRHTLGILKCLEEQNFIRTPTLAWATVLHEVGKPSAARRSDGKNFNGHEQEGARIAASIAHRLKMSQAETQRIVEIIENHLKLRDAFKMREATLERLVREPYFEELLALHKADATGSDGNLAFYEFCNSRFRAVQAGPAAPPRLIDGNDLIQLGLSPGKTFSEILRTIEDLALERKLQTKEEALEYVVKHFVR